MGNCLSRICSHQDTVGSPDIVESLNSVGSCSCAPGAAPSPSCVFYSPCILALRDGIRTEEETTRDHWTSVHSKSEAEVKRVAEDNRKYFDEVVMKHTEWGCFFTGFEDLKVGAKIGEGGQAEIFEATSTHSFVLPLHRRQKGLVAKVWKEDVSLRDLERQWPSQMLSEVARGVVAWPFNNIHGGSFIGDGVFKNRFSFVMQRQWGDLRSHIDHQMLKLLDTNSHGPPFDNIVDVRCVLHNVLTGLKGLHRAGIIHKDIKASNVLLDDLDKNFLSFAIDFECSIGITGTRFWRAPKILEQLQKGVPSHEVVFSKKADVYSLCMLCYEIITGCIPFEAYRLNDYSVVLRGERPRLPDDLNPKFRKLILDCWEHDPKCRPHTQSINIHELYRNED